MSHIPALKAAILEVIGNEATLNTVDQRWAPPTEAEDYQQEPEAIYFGDTEIVEDDWADVTPGLGTGRRQQVYRISIGILVARTGDDAQGPEERAWEIYGIVENALRTDIFSAPSTIRAAGPLQFNDISAFATTGVWGPQQWACRIDMRLFFQAIT
jgi:hypothetical protein